MGSKFQVARGNAGGGGADTCVVSALQPPIPAGFLWEW